MEKPIIGLEIGHSNIKLLECRYKYGQLIIEKAHKIPTPEGAISNGIIHDVQQIYEVIKKEIKNNKYRSKDIVAIIKSSEIITRDIHMPVMPKKDMDIILPLQYQDYLLVELSQYQVTYKVVGEVMGIDQMQQEVLIVAAPNKIIFPLLEVASKLKMRVKSINIASDAVTNIFFKHNGITIIEEEEIMVVDVGGKSTTVTIVSEGVGVLNKEILIGMDSVDPLSICELGLENTLVFEIKRFLKFYFSRSKKNAIEKIYIIGGGAYLNSINQYMTSMLNIPCVSGIELDSNLVKFSQDFEDESAYFANLLGIINEF